MTTKITEQNVSNFANLGVQWQAVVVADGSTALTVSAGKGYFIDTTSATQTVNLPANASSTLGDTIILKDYARKWNTNAVTLGSNTFDGATNTPSFNTQGQTVTLVHMGTTKGWSLLNEDTTTGLGAEYVAATGGTVATSGDFKIHTFTGDSNFVVSSGGNPAGSNTVEYLVVAGGGGGGAYTTGEPGAGAGAGAGGFRFASPSLAPATYPAKPLAAPAGLSVSAQTYPVTVGAGGAGNAPGSNNSSPGSNSVFSTITSAGGGGTKNDGSPSDGSGKPGGSGGGAGGTGLSTRDAGSGNTPPVSPSQGNDGGTYVGGGNTYYATAGGGGAMVAGGTVNPHNSDTGGSGGHGAGLPSAFGACNGAANPSPDAFRYYAGGGGGGVYGGGSGGSGGLGGGGGGVVGNSVGTAGSANTGGGGGGQGNTNHQTGGAGGKGIVVIRYKFQN